MLKWLISLSILKDCCSCINNSFLLPSPSFKLADFALSISVTKIHYNGLSRFCNKKNSMS